MTVEFTGSGEHFDAARLFREHAGYVAAFLTRLGVPRESLDDLVQDIFLVAHRRGGFVDNGQAKPTTWLAAIAIRVVSAHRRSHRRSREDADLTTVDQAAAATVRPDLAIETNESIDRVARALEHLDDKSRGVFVLFELEGESCIAIAAALEIPVGTVYSRLHYARKAFREAYSRLLQPPLPVPTPLRPVRVLS